MIPGPRTRVERVPTLGPMAPNRMPKRLRKPADEPVDGGLLRFLERNIVTLLPKDGRP
jgi:hypothetical protein